MRLVRGARMAQPPPCWCWIFWPNCGRLPQMSHFPLIGVASVKGSTRPRAKAPEAGRQLLAMAQAAERRLASEVAVINALNVFPVPDGDTGTNMLATIREALAQAAGPLEPALIPEQLALGAMRGARGNSGVILSQLFRAEHEVLRQRQAEGELNAAELAGICVRARERAYTAVSNPVEGTLLSVLSALAQAAGDGGNT